MAMKNTAVRPLVICLHASASSARQWQPLADRAGDQFDIVAPDLHGHGAGPAWLGDPRDIVEADVKRVARLTSVDRRAHLVGHSYGGAVALRMALEIPERVMSVTVYEPVLFAALRDHAPRSREALEVQAIARAVARDVRAGLSTHAARRFVDYWSGNGSFASMPAQRRDAVALRMGAVAAHFQSLWNDPMRLTDVGACAVPLTVLYGSQTRAPARRIVELLRLVRRDAQASMLTAMGHMGPLTHPATLAQRVHADLVAHERGSWQSPRKLAA